MDHPIYKFYKRLMDRHLKQMKEERYRWVCCFADQGDLTDLEFRLYWAVPASVFYKYKKQHRQLQQDTKGGKIKREWQRYNIIKKAV